MSRRPTIVPRHDPLCPATPLYRAAAGVGLAVGAGGVEGPPAIGWTPRFVLVLAFLAVGGTALAFLAWFQEVQRSALGPLAAWTFLTPLFGVAFGLVLTDERPGAWTAAGIAVVPLSFWTVVRASRDRKRAVQGKSVSVRVDLGGRRIIKHKQYKIK